MAQFGIRLKFSQLVLDSTLLTVNITGVELRNGGIDYLASLLQDSNIKFKLLGKGNCETIESIVFQNKVSKSRDS